jgi:hypothetical protein
MTLQKNTTNVMKSKNEEKHATPAHPKSSCSSFTPRSLAFGLAFGLAMKMTLMELPDYVSFQIPGHVQALDSASLPTPSRDLRSNRWSPWS